MKKSLEKLLADYLQILLPHIDDESIPAYLEERLHDLQAEIIEVFLFASDKPIFISDRKLKDIFDVVSSHLLNRKDFQFLYERLDSSGKSIDITWNYLDRFLKLRPFFLFSNLPQNVNILLSDAIRSYLYNCNRAAVILCGALLEEILTAELEKIDPNLVYKVDSGDGPHQLKMPVIIQNAIDNGLMDKKLKKDAKHVNIERNDAVHNCKLHNDNITLKIIEKTKKVMENIYEE